MYVFVKSTQNLLSLVYVCICKVDTEVVESGLRMYL